MEVEPLIEEVAEAMWSHDPERPAWAETSEYWRVPYRDMARAAVEHLCVRGLELPR